MEKKPRNKILKQVKLEDVLTLRAFADLHNISDTKVRYLAEQGKVKVVTMGGDENHRGAQMVVLSKSKID